MDLCWQSNVFAFTLPTKVRLVKAMVFPVVTYGCESWTIKKAESESEVAQWCPTLYDPVDSSPEGSSVHGILQARILEWVAILSPGDRTQVTYIAGRHFNL